MSKITECIECKEQKNKIKNWWGSLLFIIRALAFSILIWAIAVILPYLITQPNGGVENSGFAKASIFAGVGSYLILKMIDLYTEYWKPKIGYKLLTIQTLFDLVTPCIFIVGFVGEHKYWYFSVGFVTSIILGVVLCKKYDQLPKIKIEGGKKSDITKVDWFFWSMAFIFTFLILMVLY